MPFKNEIDITDLQKAEITVGDLKDIVTLLEAATSILILPDEVIKVFERLRAKIAQKGITS